MRRRFYLEKGREQERERKWVMTPNLAQSLDLNSPPNVIHSIFHRLKFLEQWNEIAFFS